MNKNHDNLEEGANNNSNTNKNNNTNKNSNANNKKNSNTNRKKKRDSKVKIALSLSTKLQRCTLNIATQQFEIFMDTMSKYWELFRGDYTASNLFSTHFYGYEYIAPYDFPGLKRNTIVVKKIKDETRIYKISELIDSNRQPTSIIKYKPLSDKFFHTYEIVYKMIDKKNSGYAFLELSSTPSYLQNCHYFQKKYASNKHTSSYDLQFFTKYLHTDCDRNKEELANVINYSAQYIPNINKTVYDDYLTKEWLHSHDKKYDFIFSNVANCSDYSSLLIESASAQIFYNMLLFAILHLNKGGSFTYNVKSVTHKVTADIILIGKKYFEAVELVPSRLENKVKFTGMDVIFRSFTGCTSKDEKELITVFDELINNDPTSKNFVVSDKKFAEKFHLQINTKTISAKTPTKTQTKTSPAVKHIESLLNLKPDDSQYDFIREVNERFYFKKTLFVQKMISNYHQYYRKNKRYDIPDSVREYQLLKSSMWAKQHDFDVLLPSTKIFRDEFGRMVLSNLFMYHDPIVLKMANKPSNINSRVKNNTFDKLFTGNNKHSNNTSNNSSNNNSSSNNSSNSNSSNSNTLLNKRNKDEFFDKLEQYGRDFQMTTDLIDTRDVTEWFKVKPLQFFKPNDSKEGLGYLIQQKTGVGKISQAWIKMYEMVALFLADTMHGKTTYKSFNYCEAPGNFIAAINHYIHSKTKIEKYEWAAQSLSPKIANIGDDYGYIRKYPKQWDFGKDGTGDITNVENIKYYAKYCEGADLMTSDCGLAKTRDEHDIRLKKAHFAQMVMMFVNLPAGGSFVGKFVLPIEDTLEVDMIYLMFQSCEQLIFYKSPQNMNSGEFYIILKGYKGIDDKLKTKMFDYLKSFSAETLEKRILAEDYTEEFIIQFLYFIKTLSDNYVFYIERRLYFVDNFKHLNESMMRKIKRYVKQKNEDWIKQFRPKPIRKGKAL